MVDDKRNVSHGVRVVVKEKTSSISPVSVKNRTKEEKGRGEEESEEKPVGEKGGMSGFCRIF